jgi:large subunit ribosomal protein L24
MKVKKGDQVLIISGKDRGRKGKAIKALLKEGKIVVEGMNIQRKHIKPKKQGEKGQVVEISAPINVSNVKVICPKCGKPTRVGGKEKPKTNLSTSSGLSRAKSRDKNQKLKEKSKIRICKKCGQEI